MRMKIIYLYLSVLFIYKTVLILSWCLSYNRTSSLKCSVSRTNSGTSTTNVTQTRVTHRPHVHVTPLNVPGMGMNQFDPFLPCQSHHIRPATRRRHQAQTQVGWSCSRLFGREVFRLLCLLMQWIYILDLCFVCLYIVCVVPIYRHPLSAVSYVSLHAWFDVIFVFASCN